MLTRIATSLQVSFLLFKNSIITLICLQALVVSSVIFISSNVTSKNTVPLFSDSQNPDTSLSERGDLQLSAAKHCFMCVWFALILSSLCVVSVGKEFLTGKCHI